VGEPQILEEPDFVLRKGAILPVARLAYRTLGELNAARDNAVLVPSWFSGTDSVSEFVLTGPGRALDPARYFIILTNLLGNGRSSSPSNTAEPFERGRFPSVTVHDNVRLQHRLVTEVLGVEKLRLVAGWSMGAAQSFQWGAQYPDRVNAIVPIAGSARTGSFNQVFLYSLRRALTLDPHFDGGYYTRPPVEGIKAFATIYAGWGTSEPFFREKVYRAFGAADHREFVEYFWEPFYLKNDANDLLAQLTTWGFADISDSDAYRGDFAAALGGITARAIVMPTDHDRYFPPVDSRYETEHMPNAECRVVEDVWGHMAPMNPANVQTYDAALTEALETAF
jgi:homoserine O-acetyltransferase/O-succinyltransferase